MLQKALIVDDEFAAHEIMKYIIDWEKAGFYPPASAYDGKQALQLYKEQDFDIVFTDIVMPIMDGLELIAKIKELNPMQKVVIISCHEKFEYARRAMQMGVEDYLIKDLITEQELYSLLMNKLETKYYSGSERNRSPIQVSDIVSKYISGVSLSERETEYLSARLGFAKKSAVCAMYIVVDDYEWLIHTFDKGEISLKLLRLKTQIKNECAAFVDLDNGRWLAVYEVGAAYSTLNYINNVMQLSNSLRQIALECGFNSLSIGISNSAYSLEELQKVYMQACEAAEMRIFYGMDKNILYSVAVDKKQPFLRSKIESSLKEIRRMVIVNNTDVLEAIDRLYRADFSDGFKEVNYYKYVNNSLTVLCYEIIDSKNLDKQIISKQAGALPEKANKLDTPQKMSSYFKSLIKIIMEFEVSVVKDDDDILKKSKRIIEENFEKDISLNFVAEKLHVHKGYLCRVFKEKTGENLMQYIMNKKIERAKKLLEATNMRAVEISESLGFATPQYFNMVFKKSVGVSPNEYKKNIKDTRN